jgi:hypothetical protein
MKNAVRHKKNVNTPSTIAGTETEFVDSEPSRDDDLKVIDGRFAAPEFERCRCLIVLALSSLKTIS